ncbi:potassium channel subfamily K member 13 [Fopius arisanus]|uniref:Kcnk12 protein n=1 Tax=Fopius arisanus TaxID=64838 RepID=A0A0C9QZ88_9HYME|nr:PREDICTED: potassium channel subfamily K member 13-like [Fopius arisanus]
MCLSGAFAEDNIRFVLLAIFLACYMLAGAVLFQTLESEVELHQATEFWRVYHVFRRYHLRSNPQATERLNELLYAYSNASATGIIHKRRRWDFSGSFHFVGTIVSTIGYGTTTPQTRAGRLAVIVYGFFGCSGGILFFNLFLERIITFLAWVLRTIHLRRLKKRLRQTTLASRRVASRPSNPRMYLPDILDEENEDDMGLDHWKPSVYWVMLYLTIFSCLVAGCGASLYALFEGWGYLDALYFCFISFATIGFGDYVSTEKDNYPYIHFYRIINFLVLVLGCCCIYSLLNVTSIVIKQMLNCVIMKLNKIMGRRRAMAAPHLPRRKSSVSGFYYSRRRHTRVNCVSRRDSVRGEDSSASDTPRRMSGELISMKDFLTANKVALAVMQKQLHETAQMQRGSPSVATPIHQGVFKPGAVGPLAIATEKFEGNATR